MGTISGLWAGQDHDYLVLIGGCGMGDMSGSVDKNVDAKLDGRYPFICDFTCFNSSSPWLCPKPHAQYFNKNYKSIIITW